MNDYYAILGINETASREEIKKAFSEKVLKLHPDHRPPSEKEQAEADFRQLFEAYNHLRNGGSVDLEQELEEIFSSFVQNGDFSQSQWARTMFETYRAQARAADAQPYPDTKVTEFEFLLESPTGLYVGLWIRNSQITLKIPKEEEQKTLNRDRSVFALDDLLNAIKEELEPRGYQQNVLRPKNPSTGESYPVIQVFNKRDLVSTREGFNGKNEVRVGTHSSYAFSVTKEDGKKIYIPHESLTAESNPFEFRKGYTFEGFPIVINEEELTVILDSFWVASGKALGSISNVLFHPLGWDIMPSQDQLRRKYGKEGSVMCVDGFSTYVFNHTLDDGTLETVTLQDRQNSGFLIPFVYIASRKLINPVGIIDAKQILDEMSLISIGPKELKEGQKYALKGEK